MDTPFEVVDQLLTIPVLRGLQASFVIGGANTIFGQQPEHFRSNPANCLTHTALSALEDRAIVQVAEVMQSKLDAVKLPVDFRQKARVVQHRHVLSHPYQLEFRNPDVQRFFADKGHVLDVKVVLLWSFAHDLKRRLAEINKPCSCANVPITYEMGALLGTILRESFVQESLSLVPDAVAAAAMFQKYRDEYLDQALALADQMFAELEAAADQ